MESGEQLKPFGELQDRLDAEFAEYIEYRSSETRRGMVEAIKLGFGSEDDIESAVGRERKELVGLDPYRRVGRLLNNFSLWWPGGYYRTLFPGHRIIADLDTAIRDGGLEEMAGRMGRKEGLEQEERVKILADIYIRMRDRGYNRAELTK
ncbi:MAG: hypothetical protein HYW91_01285 [Candidatus Sungbacteria bacterium]|nr:hypothetical protein [Candidatus Sungbacteria bacterium]